MEEESHYGENMGSTNISCSAHPSWPLQPCWQQRVTAVCLSILDVRMRRAKRNITFSFLICLTAAAPILLGVSCAQQPLPEKVLDEEKEGKVSPECMLQSKALEPKACKIGFGCLGFHRLQKQQ